MHLRIDGKQCKKQWQNASGNFSVPHCWLHVVEICGDELSAHLKIFKRKFSGLQNHILLCISH